MAVNFDHQQDRITTQSGSLSINTSGSIKIPVGNTAQRPGTVATGQIRFNTQLSRFEGYNGSAWTGLGAVADADQDTFIETDKTADDDFLRFYTQGTERVTIDNNGKLTALFDFDLTGTFDNSSNTGAMILAQGTDAERPGTPQTGMLRFSTTSSKAEVYDGSAWVEVGTTPPVTEAFKNFAVSGQSDVVADTATDTLTFVAGTGITITTDATTDEITINSTASTDTFKNIAVSGQNNVVADSSSDTLTLVAGTNMTITTDDATDTITFASGGSANSVIDADSDTHIKVETNADEDIIRFTTAGTERANINATGVLTIGDSAGTTFYSFPTARGTNGQLLSIDANGVLNFIDAQIAELYYQNNAPTTGLNTGQLWFDTGITGELYVYTGSEWISTTPGADTGFIKQNYTGDGTTTAYDTQTGVNGGTVSLVFVNGVLVQPTNDYNEVGGVVTFVSAPLNGDQIDIMITGSLVTLALNPLGLNNHNLITVDSSGELTVNSLVVSDLTDNRVVIAGTSGQIEDDANFTFDGTNLVVSTTGAVQLPAGTTAQRPGSAVNGMFRYNTTDNAFEGYASGAWGAIGGAGGIALTDLSITTASAGTAALSYDNTTGVFTYTPPDLSSYLTSYTETNDLTSAVVWANIPDTNVPQSAVTQHQAALSITESQISDLGTYLTAEADTLDDVIGRGATTTTTAVIPFYYANQAAFPNATTYHGAIGHSHSDGAMYFAHGGNWNKLANDSDIAVNTAGDSGSGTVNLSTQTLSVIGTTNEIQTSVTNQTVTIGLPTDVTVQGNLTVDTNTLYVDATANRVGIGTATPSEALHVDGAIRVDGVSTLKTSTATVTSTNATTIDTFDASVDRSAKYIIQATDTVTGEYQIAEAVCIHDGTTAYITIYGIVYTGSAEIATYSANYSNVGEFELQATGASANSTVYKVTRLSTLV